MTLSRKVILFAPDDHSDPRLEAFVERAIIDKVQLICVIGFNAEKIEHTIDEIVVGDGSDDTRFIVTTAHADETLDAVQNFAKAWVSDGLSGTPAEEVRLPER